MRLIYKTESCYFDTQSQLAPDLSQNLVHTCIARRSKSNRKILRSKDPQRVERLVLPWLTNTRALVWLNLPQIRAKDPIRLA